MSYTPAELAAFDPELRALADEVVVVLGKYADAATTAEAVHHQGRFEQIAKTFELCGFPEECRAIRKAAVDLHRFVEPRLRHARDAVSSFSIPNYYPEGHPARRSYEIRVAAEKQDYALNFATARAAILATVGLKLGGTALDATLASLAADKLDGSVAVRAEARAA